jgi:hypothetical protein
LFVKSCAISCAEHPAPTTATLRPPPQEDLYSLEWRTVPRKERWSHILKFNV